jgi:PAS domain S-box-containing protein
MEQGRGTADSEPRAEESYAQYRARLIAAGFPAVAAVVSLLTLAYVAADLIDSPARFRAELLPNTLQVIIPLIGWALVRGPLRKRAEIMALATDLAYTTILASRLLLPTTTVSGVALFLALKVVSTALLFPWAAPVQYASASLTVLLYFVLLLVRGEASRFSPTWIHQLLGPLIAAALSAVGAASADRIRRRMFSREIRLAQSERRLQSMLDAEQAIVETARQISALTNLPTLLERINRLITEVLGCDFSNTFLLDDERQEFVATSTYSTAADLRDEVLSLRLAADAPVALELAGGRTIVINNPHDQPWFDPKRMEELRARRMVLTPIMIKDRLLGALTAGYGPPGSPFDDRQISVLKGVAAQAAVAIQNTSLFADLADSEARYRDLFEHANDLIFAVDETGRFHFANRAALEFMTVRPEDLGEASLLKILSVRTFSQVMRRMSLAQRRKLDPGRPFTLEVFRPDGQIAVLEVRSRLISPPGEPRIFQCIARDATERREQEQRTANLLHRLREANRLQAEFVANMSHELRTPLNVIIGYTDILLEDPVLPIGSEARYFVERIGTGARVLHRLVESVLEYARLDRGLVTLLPTRFSVDRLLHELNLLCAEVPASPEVAVHIEDAPGIELTTDYGRLYSVLSNLLLNAIKFTQRGEVELSIERHNGQIEFRVRDTGIGIPVTELDHVFEPFRQVDGSPTRAFGGVGLGLAIVRRNVELLGGTVKVESSLGAGSTFRVRIPTDLPVAESRSA